jgi:hypothetical protein
MHALGEIKIGIRLQAEIVLFLTAFWFLAAWIGWHNDGVLNLFWAATLYYLPVVYSIFTLILLVSYWRTGRTHRRWVYVATLAAVSCWAVIFAFLLLAWYL